MTPGRSRTQASNHRHGGEFAAGEDVIADRDFLERTCLDHPLIDAFEAAAHDDDAAVRAASASTRACVKRRAARRHQTDVGG